MASKEFKAKRSMLLHGHMDKVNLKEKFFFPQQWPHWRDDGQKVFIKGQMPPSVQGQHKKNYIIIVKILVRLHRFSCAGMWPRVVSLGGLSGVPRLAAFSEGLWLVTLLVTWEGRRQTYDGVDTMQTRVTSWWFIICLYSLLKTVLYSVRSSRNANPRTSVW